MATALVAGETIHSFLASATRAQLPADEHARVEGDVARWAARGAYAGLALWMVGSLTRRDAVRDVGEALAGVSMGLLKRASLAGRN